ncbi:Thiol:disulfide interchange protein DsbD [uncultured archaeon]|nr:Thiol:disulfide interchange protein DsbD [uncultured archaeon]
MADPITLGRITILAFINSVNPCQIAMLILVLVAIMGGQEEVKAKKRILYAGLAFISAIFLGYLFYGLVLVQLFQTFTSFLLTGSVYLKYFIAIFSMVIGALQIKDFFMYKPGSLGTEMPIWMRSKAKRIIEKITSPAGAFVIGIIISLFLTPCTMAPLLVATESLANLGLLGALPWLLYFNLIIVLPLLIITFIVYKGLGSAQQVSDWRARNIRKMHLIAGIIFLLVGFSLLLGWL